MARKLHRWMPPTRPTAQLTIRICANCGLAKHSHHQVEGGREVHWSTFHFRDGTKHRAEGTPNCTGYVPVRERARPEEATA